MNAKKILLWAFGGVAVTFVLGWLWTKGERVVGHDPFHYIYYGKYYVAKWPHYFGTSWPFGYSLLGSLGGRAGWSVYWTLVAVNQAAYLLVYILFLRFALKEGAGLMQVLAVVMALVCAPIVAQLGVITMSEPLFAGLLFAAGCSMAFWPKPGAVLLTGVLANAAFATRYVGIFVFGLIGLMVLRHFWSANRRERLWMVAFAGAAFALMGALCYTNYAQYGRITGPHPVGSESLTSWPWHFAELGWSMVGAFSSGQLMNALGGSSHPLVFTVGLAVATAAVGLCALALRKWRSKPVAAHVGLVTMAYILTIVTMRANTYFDNLFNPRTSLPAIFGLAFVAVSILPRSKWLPLAAAASVCLSVALAWRGMPAVVVPNIDFAKDYLRQHLQAGDEVTVSADGRRLTAYFPNSFTWALIAPGKEYDWKPGLTRFTVVVTEETAKKEKAKAEQIAWQAAVRKSVESGLMRIAAQDARTVILERAVRNSEELPGR